MGKRNRQDAPPPDENRPVERVEEAFTPGGEFLTKESSEAEKDAAGLSERQQKLLPEDGDLRVVPDSGEEDVPSEGEDDPQVNDTDMHAVDPETGEKTPHLFKAHGVEPADKDAEREARLAAAPHPLEGQPGQLGGGPR